MISLITESEAQKKISEMTRQQRLQQELTQKTLAERSGVALPTLRLFERTGSISLTSFLKIQMALGNLDAVLKAMEIKEVEYLSLDDMIKASNKPKRQRGKRT
jgi:transcriptional regulator with XRE-family HTH domain